MKSSEALLKLARSASQMRNHTHSAAVSSRLLSHSQASTSAASGNASSEASIHQADRLDQLRCLNVLAAIHAGHEHQAFAAHARKFTSSTVHRARDRSGTASGESANRATQHSVSAANADNLHVQGRHSAKNAAQAELALTADSSESGRSGGAADQSEPAEGEEELGFGYVEDGQFPYSPSQVEVVNLAGSTETTWEFLGSMDDQAVVWYGMDFTRGTCPEVERNALLSNEAKEMMYQMHRHDKKRYSQSALADIFKIRQQRVLAILTLKGMEHGDIPLQTGSKAASQQSAPARTDRPTDAAAAASDTPDPASDASAADDSPAQTPDSEAADGLDSRSQIVKEAMDAASKDIPEYLRQMERQSNSWSFESPPAETKDQATDRNILLAWLKSLVKDPFWVRPEKGAKETEPVVEDAAAVQDTKAAAKADLEAEQQLLQDATVAQQRNRAPTNESDDTVDPKEEGVQRYLLSNPDYLPYIMEHELWDCHEFEGTGERHVKFIPRYPRFEWFKDDRPEALEADAAAPSGKANIKRPVLSFWDEANRLQAEEEEEHLVREFRENLKYNLQQSGASINRQSRSKAVPSRPKAGWSMVVQDTSTKGQPHQYVALPDGKSRELTTDERVYLDRMKPKKRKKII